MVATKTNNRPRTADKRAMAKKASKAARGSKSGPSDAALAVFEDHPDLKTTVAQIEKQIKADLDAERAKVPAIVASLTDEVYKVALS